MAAGQSLRTMECTRATLTPREEEVLELMMLGLSHKQMAHKLEVSYKTITKHMTNMYDRLGVKRRCKIALIMAYLFGIIDLDKLELVINEETCH